MVLFVYLLLSVIRCSRWTYCDVVCKIARDKLMNESITWEHCVSWNIEYKNIKNCVINKKNSGYKYVFLAGTLIRKKYSNI